MSLVVIAKLAAPIRQASLKGKSISGYKYSFKLQVAAVQVLQFVDMQTTGIERQSEYVVECVGKHSDQSIKTRG